MPFNPPPPQDPARLLGLVLSMRNQQRDEQARQQQFELVQQQKNKQARDQAMDLAFKGLKPKQIIALMPDEAVTSGFEDALGGISQLVSQQQKQQSAAGQQGTEARQSFAEIVAGANRANPTSTGLDIAAAAQAAGQTFGPEFAAQFVTTPGEALARSFLSSERGELDKTLAEERRGEARTIAGERRALSQNDREDAVKELRRAKAELIDQPSADSQALMLSTEQTLIERVGLEEFERIALVADQGVAAEVSRLRRERTSVGAGTQELLQAAADRRETMETRFGKDQVDQVSDSAMREVVRGNLIEDPLLAEWEGDLALSAVGGEADMNRFLETRSAQSNLLHAFDKMTKSFDELRIAKREGRAGFVGAGIPTGFEDLKVFFGAGTPEAAAYRNSMFEFVSALLRARQGSRPSDFDLRMYMSLAPTLQELMSGTADAKLNALRSSLMGAIRSRQMGRQVQRIKNSPDTAMDKRLEANITAFEKKVTDGTATPEDFAKFHRSMTSWQNQRGDQFIVPLGDGTPNSGASPETAEMLDSLGLGVGF